MSAYFGLVPRQYQSGETDRNGRITKRGNPLARTILVECAWSSLRYNPWAKVVYERISGKQKTRRKKAAVALARKICVIAWALLRDEKDWEPQRMIEVTESYGKMPTQLKDTLQSMKPKENSDQRNSRLRREARQAKAAATEHAQVIKNSATAKTIKPVKKTIATEATQRENSVKSEQPTRTTQVSTASTIGPTKTTKPRRARKPVSRSAAHA